jgi:hypothetical protein
VDCEAKESITKLRQLRDSLCKKQSEWKKAFAVKDMIVIRLKDIKQTALDSDIGRDILIQEIDALLILVDPERQQELEG